MEERSDVVFFAASSRIGRSKFPLTKIGLHFWVRDGDHNRLPDEEIATEDSGIRYLRAQDLKEGEITSNDSVYITKQYFSSVERSHIKPGYLLFSIMASIGNSAVVPEDFSIATANRAVGILIPKQENPNLTWFLFYLFLTDFGRELYTRIKKGGLQQRANLADIEVIDFPLPPELIQKKIVAAMDAARAERRAKLAEADALLAGLDDFLLDALGLTPPPKDERKVFAATVRSASKQYRLNADYFHPERILALRAMEAADNRVPYVKLSEVVSFIRDQIKMPGQNYLSLAHVQSNTGELKNANEEAAGACSVFQSDDVLFARLRPYLNKVYRAEMEGCCSPEFHVLRIKNIQDLLPDYLAAILRSKLTLAQTRHMMTGNTHPRLGNEDVVNLVIPIPKSIAIQHAIATEARRRREEARRLRAEAETDWQAAKRWFEEQLLGAENSGQ
jgi:restriction endonuclease S subunit